MASESLDLTKLIKTKPVAALEPSRRLGVLFATSEVAPFSKTGGLGDVAASLPRALASRGHRVSVLTPLYGHIDPHEHALARRLQTISVPRKAKSQSPVEATIWEGRSTGGVRLFFLQCDEYFGRPGVYGYDGETFEDNARRYAFFARAVVEFARQSSVPVDVIHCNDWHTALAPVYAQQYYKSELADVGVVLTLHNAAYQGQFDGAQFADTGLPKSSLFTDAKLKHNDGVNFLKGGVVFSDVINAVSPTYAEELRTEGGGFGLDDLFRDRGDKLVGILNGADYAVWSPDRDHHIAVSYDVDGLNGKRRNKAELQHEFGLPVRPVLPLIGFVGRLTEQKGLDILVPTVRKLLKKIEGERDGFQIVFLGDGDKKYQTSLNRLAKDFPDRVAIRVGYDEAAAHRIIAGSDILAVPSRYEPCGLTQIYAMKYGTIPVVHATGGLADTVRDADADADGGTGFLFDKYTKGAVEKALVRATTRYRSHRSWRPLMVQAMAANFSWGRVGARVRKGILDGARAQLIPQAANAIHD